MRRPRSKLEVSTFPFLAVLLCAMGALLLLLFIMDRRAKIAAQNSARESLAARKKRTVEEEAARQSEWEKAKELLHQTLLQQQNALLLEVGGVNEQLDNAGKGIIIVQAKRHQLDQEIKRENDQIQTVRVQIASRRDSVKQAELASEKHEAMSKAELAAAGKELAELEQAHLLMKTLRERDKQVYSVVPYRGKRGDLRPPIYVECVRDGVIFHPEKRSLGLWEMRPDRLRSEVERRAGPVSVDSGGREQPASATRRPYVLFLVRPTGIANYYKAQSALRGYQLDFGYELVDEHWSLDFAGDAIAQNGPNHAPRPGMGVTTPPSQGGLAFGPGNSGAMGTPGMGQLPGNGATGSGMPGTFGSGYGGGSGGSSMPGSGSGYGGLPGPIGGMPRGNGVGPLLPAPPLGGYGGGFGTRGTGIAGLPGTGGTGSPLPPPPVGSYPGVPGVGTGGTSLPPPPLGYPNYNGGQPGVYGSNRIPSGSYPGGNGPSGSGVGTGQASPGSGSPGATGDPKNPAFVPIGRPGSGNPYLGTPASNGNSGGTKSGPEMIASAGPRTISPTPPGTGNYPAGSGGVYGTGPASGSPSPSSGQGSPGGTAPGTPGGAQGSPGNAGPPTPGGAGGTSPGQGAPGSGAAGQNPAGAGGAAGQNPAGAGSAAGQSGPGGGDGSTGQGTPGGGGSGQGDPGGGDGMPGPRPIPGMTPDGPKRRPAPAPLSKVLGNKDFVITIACYANHANVFPGGTLHRFNGPDTQAADKLLVQTVTNVIARRQASVRPGEPPYQPLLRFQVSTEGLRTYYHVYPLLEHLRVPMSRENKSE